MRVMGCNLALISRSEPEFTYVASSGATFTREAEKTSLCHYPYAAKASFVRALPLHLSLGAHFANDLRESDRVFSVSPCWMSSLLQPGWHVQNRVGEAVMTGPDMAARVRPCLAGRQRAQASS